MANETAEVAQSKTIVENNEIHISKHLLLVIVLVLLVITGVACFFLGRTLKSCPKPTESG